MDKIELGKIVEIQIGKTPSRSIVDYWGIGYDWLSISDLTDLKDGKYILNSKEQITEKATQETGITEVESNTIVFSYKLSIGKIAITKKPFYTNEAIAAFKIKKPYEVDLNYLFYALKSIRANDFADQGAKGFTLNKAKLSSLLIPIVNIEQQYKIASRLDLLQSIINKRIQAIDVMGDLIDATFSKMFGNAFSGDKFKLRSLNDEQAIDLQSGFAFSSKDFKESGTPIIKISNVNKGYFESNSLSFIDKTKFSDLDKYIVKPLDLVITLTGTQGKDDYANIAIINSEHSEYLLNQRLSKFIINETLYNRVFVLSLFRDINVKRYLLQQGKGARQANISNEMILALHVIRPNIQLQNEFQNKVDIIVNSSEEIKRPYCQYSGIY